MSSLLGGTGSVFQQRMAAVQAASGIGGKLQALIQTIGVRFRTTPIGSALQATVSGPATVGVGGTATYTVAATGGTPPYTYEFYSTIPGTQNGSVYTVLPTVVGAESIFAVVTDSAGGTATTAITPFTVTTSTPPPTPLTAQIAGPSTVNVDTSATFTVTPSGGVGPYTYAFNSTILGSQDGNMYIITPGAEDSGSGTISCTVTDSVGDSATTPTASFTVVVSPPGTVEDHLQPATDLPDCAWGQHLQLRR